MHEQLSARDRRILLSESQPLILRRAFFAALGVPEQRSPQWCRDSIEVLISGEYWAPEIDWAVGDPLELHFVSAANARWVFEAAARAGYEAQLDGAEAAVQRCRVLVYRGEPGVRAQ